MENYLLRFQIALKKNILPRDPLTPPHLIFFTKKSWEKNNKKMSLSTIDLSYSSYSLDYAFSAMQNSKNLFGSWKPKKLNFKNIMRKIIPNYLINLRRKLIRFKKSENNDRSINFFLNNNPNSWCIRVLLKNKN